MTDRFANLTKACGGSLTIESLTEFQLAMREYEIFMGGMRELLAPVEPQEFALAHQVDSLKGDAR